jgi:hypothetical protein
MSIMLHKKHLSGA